MATSTRSTVFEAGLHEVRFIRIDPEARKSSPPPPKPLLIATPLEEGDYPVLVFLHGYLLQNEFYSQLFQHLASHGFVVVAPQLYRIAGPDSTNEIRSAAETLDWLPRGLAQIIPNKIIPNTNKVAVGGHSRGAKVAFALSLGHAKTTVKISAILAVDPVDGMDKNRQTNPPILTGVSKSLDFQTAVLVVGCGLGGLRKNPLFPPCAPEGVSHQEFFDESCSIPAVHLVAKDYGHMDMLDDETKGILGKATYCLCKNGKARKPMRLFVAGAMVAFMRAYLDDNGEALMEIKINPGVAPVEISIMEFLI